MAVETVLMYNCDDEQWAKLRQIFLMLRVHIRPVEADQYGLTLEDLLGRSEEKATVEEEFSDPMLVFCNLPMRNWTTCSPPWAGPACPASP